MRTMLNLLLAFAVFFAGCAGREANPIPVYLPGDENLNCEALKFETAQLQADMVKLLPKTNKDLTNTLWAAGGAFLIVPFFFMDFKNAEKIEYDAMRRRHNRLLVLAAQNNCNMSGIRAERIPSLEQQKDEADIILRERKPPIAGKKISGYQAERDQKTGEMRTFPVYKVEK